MVSAPALHAFLPPESAPEVAPEPTSCEAARSRGSDGGEWAPRWEGAGVATEHVSLSRGDGGERAPRREGAGVATEHVSLSRGDGGERAPGWGGDGGGDGGRGSPPWYPVEAGASARLLRRPRPLHVTQQWCLWRFLCEHPGGRAAHPVPSGCLLTANISPLPGRLSKPRVPAPSPCRHQWTPSQAGARRAVARTICVGLSLSCLQQTSCWALLRAPKLPFCPS